LLHAAPVFLKVALVGLCRQGVHQRAEEQADDRQYHRKLDQREAARSCPQVQAHRQFVDMTANRSLKLRLVKSVAECSSKGETPSALSPSNQLLSALEVRSCPVIARPARSNTARC